MWLGLGEAIEHWARYKPKDIAVNVGSHGYPYGDLYKRTKSICRAIDDYNLSGRIAIGVNDKFELLACIVAMSRLGLSSVLLDPKSDQESLEVHLQDTKPSLALGDDDLLQKINYIAGPELSTLDITDISNTDKTASLTRAINEEWGVLFSSGSTGISKAIVYDNAGMISELLAWCLELGIRRDTRFYVGRPIYYTGGLVLTLATLLVGGEVFMPSHTCDSDFSAIWLDYQNCLTESSLDFAFFIPEQLRHFMSIANDTCLGGPTILVMGAPITGSEKLQAHRELKSPIIESWGNSEGLGTITDEEDLFVRPDSIGRPFLTENLYIVTEDLELCKSGQIGRLAGSEETMFVEYANRPDATKKVKRNNLILSDDIGYVDDDYYFYILGRDQESFVIDGKTVFLFDIEVELRKIPGIADGCIVAKEGDGLPAFYAAVVCRKNGLEESLNDSIIKSISLPITGCLFLSELPRLLSGKIDRLKVVSQLGD